MKVFTFTHQDGTSYMFKRPPGWTADMRRCTSVPLQDLPDEVSEAMTIEAMEQGMIGVTQHTDGRIEKLYPEPQPSLDDTAVLDPDPEPYPDAHENHEDPTTLS